MTVSEHPSDLQLERHADALGTRDPEPEVAEHVRGCDRCREIVRDLRRGLARLMSASEPPAELARQARARRWAVARTGSASQALSDEPPLMAEAGGRDRDAEKLEDQPSSGSTETREDDEIPRQ